MLRTRSSRRKPYQRNRPFQKSRIPHTHAHSSATYRRMLQKRMPSIRQCRTCPKRQLVLESPSFVARPRNYRHQHERIQRKQRRHRSPSPIFGNKQRRRRKHQRNRAHQPRRWRTYVSRMTTRCRKKESRHRQQHNHQCRTRKLSNRSQVVILLIADRRRRRGSEQKPNRHNHQFDSS